MAFDKLKAKAAALKREVFALYLAARDPRTPWYAKCFLICVVAYALSPIDLIPDPVPILGYLDDLLLLPFGIYLALRMIPPEILTDCRAMAASTAQTMPRNWYVAGGIILLWLTALAFLAYCLITWLRRGEPSAARFGY